MAIRWPSVNLRRFLPANEIAVDLGTSNTLIYVISHESRDAAKKSWQAFISDPEWKKVAAASEVDGKILAKPPESVYMDPTDYSPVK